MKISFKKTLFFFGIIFSATSFATVPNLTFKEKVTARNQLQSLQKDFSVVYYELEQMFPNHGTPADRIIDQLKRIRSSCQDLKDTIDSTFTAEERSRILAFQYSDKLALETRLHFDWDDKYSTLLSEDWMEFFSAYIDNPIKVLYEYINEEQDRTTGDDRVGSYFNNTRTRGGLLFEPNSRVIPYKLSIIDLLLRDTSNLVGSTTTRVTSSATTTTSSTPAPTHH